MALRRSQAVGKALSPASIRHQSSAAAPAPRGRGQTTTFTFGSRTFEARVPAARRPRDDRPRPTGSQQARPGGGSGSWQVSRRWMPKDQAQAGQFDDAATDGERSRRPPRRDRREGSPVRAEPRTPRARTGQATSRAGFKYDLEDLGGSSESVHSAYRPGTGRPPRATSARPSGPRPARPRRPSNRTPGVFISEGGKDAKFSTPDPTTAVDVAEGRLALSSSMSRRDLSPSAVPKDAGEIDAPVGEDRLVSALLEQMSKSSFFVSGSAPRQLPSPGPSSSSHETTTSPLARTGFGAATREDAVVGAAAALAHGNPSIRADQKADLLALVGFAASTRDQRAASAKAKASA